MIVTTSGTIISKFCFSLNLNEQSQKQQVNVFIPTASKNENV